METKNLKKGFETVALRRLVVLSLSLVVLPMPGCAHKEKAPVNPPAAAAPRALEPAIQPETTANAAKPFIERRALDRLRQMSETLASAKSFTYRSHSIVEVPAETGQFLTFFAHANVTLNRPNKLRADITGDVPNFQIVYDGSHVSVFDPRKNLYAVSKAPATIDEMLKFLMAHAGINFPSPDLMFSNPYAAMTKNLKSAFVVGLSTVNSSLSEHLAFMGPEINWEIWIDTGKNALPRRLAVTHRGVTNFPRFLVEFSDWNLNPRVVSGQFMVKRPANAKQIEFAAQISQDFKELEGGQK